MRSMNYERRRRNVAKRVAPNEPTHRASRRPGMGRGRKDEVQSTKDEKGRSCGIEEVVSGQSSVVSRVFSGDLQGSAGEVRISDCGKGSGSRVTNHAKANWPNKAIPSQNIGAQWLGIDIATIEAGRANQLRIVDWRLRIGNWENGNCHMFGDVFSGDPEGSAHPYLT